MNGRHSKCAGRSDRDRQYIGPSAALIKSESPESDVRETGADVALTDDEPVDIESEGDARQVEETTASMCLSAVS